MLRLLLGVCVVIALSGAGLSDQPLEIKIGYLRQAPSRIRISLIDVPALLVDRLPAIQSGGRGKRVAVATTTGGGAAMVVDNMAMAWGVETRVPFLDHEVVELAARIPAELKVRDGGKYILKQASRGLVPDEVIDRPKGYFPVPALKYLRGPFYDFVREVLDAPVARQRGLFNRYYVDRLLADPDGELTPKGHSKLWQIAVLECWLQTQQVGNRI